MLDTNDWKDTWPTCGDGKQQSPIFIDSTTAQVQTFSPIVSVGSPKTLNTVLIVNTGGTLQFTPYPDEKDSLVLTGGCLGDAKWKFVQTHFHWTKSDDITAEHSVDDIKYIFFDYF